MRQAWGQAAILQLQAPELAGDDRFRDWYGRFERYGASPGTALARPADGARPDVRHVLPAIQCPVLILHRAGRRDRPGGARPVSGRARSGRSVHRAARRGPRVLVRRLRPDLAEIQQFLTGTPTRRSAVDACLRPCSSPTSSARPRPRRGWATTAGHDSSADYRLLVRRELRPVPGPRGGHAGDGLLATFDGPARGIRCAAESGTPCGRSESTFGPGCTPARSSGAATASPASPCTSASVCRPRPIPVRSSYREPSSTSSPDPTFASRIEALARSWWFRSNGVSLRHTSRRQRPPASRSADVGDDRERSEVLSRRPPGPATTTT